MFTSVLSLSIVAIVLLVLVEVKSDSDKKEWQLHSARVEQFKCGEPQPRSFHFHDLVKEYPRSANDKIYPPSTVLYRCESAGCCPADKECLFEDKEDIVLVFGIYKHGNKVEYMRVNAENHKSCSCQKNGNKPK